MTMRDPDEVTHELLTTNLRVARHNIRGICLHIYSRGAVPPKRTKRSVRYHLALLVDEIEAAKRAMEEVPNYDRA